MEEWHDDSEAARFLLDRSRNDHAYPPSSISQRGHSPEEVILFVRLEGGIDMATVTAFRIPGLPIWFWSNDREPPHFHVKRRGESEVKVFFMLATATRSRAAEHLAVVETNAEYEALCLEQVRRLPPRLRSAFSSRPVKGAASSPSTLVVSRLADLPRVAIPDSARSGTTKQVIFVNEFPVEAVAARLMSLQIRSSQRLYIASDRDRASEGELIYRLLSGMAEHDGSKTIVDAWVEGDDLVLLSPCFDRMAISGKKPTRFLGNDSSMLSKFEIDEDGRFLHWPHSDTHLGWKQLHQLIEPTAVLEDAKKTDQFKASYGEAIRTLRVSLGIKQSDVVGLTPRQLRRIEHGEQIVFKKALESLSAAHTMPIDDYLQKLATLASRAATKTR